MTNGDPFRFVRSGDKLSIPAVRHNGWQRAAKYVDEQRRSGPGAGGPAPEGLVWIRNHSGGDVNRFGVLGIDTALVKPVDSGAEFRDRYALDCITPAQEHQGRFVITFDPIADGEVGRAWAFGVCPVRIKSTDIGAKFLDVLPGKTNRLTSGSAGGAQVLFSGADSTVDPDPDDDADSWAVVRFNGGGSLPRPQYQDQMYGGVSQNQVGFKYITAHAVTTDEEAGSI